MKDHETDKTGFSRFSLSELTSRKEDDEAREDQNFFF